MVVRPFGSQHDGIARDSRPRRGPLVEGKLSGAYRGAQPVSGGRQRTTPRVVVRAVRVVRSVEVEREAATALSLGLDITAGAVSLFPTRPVAERNEQLVALLVGDERKPLAGEVKTHRAKAMQPAGRAVAHLDVFGVGAFSGIDRDREPVRRVLREVAQAAESRALLDGERRIVLPREVFVLRTTKTRDVHHVRERARWSAHSAPKIRR